MLHNRGFPRLPVITDQASQAFCMSMRARFTALLPMIAAAAALLMGGGDARAIMIRYSFEAPSDPSYTGGTIRVGSLTQTLATGPLNFIVETGSGPFAVVAPFSSANNSRITYQNGSTALWNLEDFDFAGVTGATQWSDLLVRRKFEALNTPTGRFLWYNSSGIGTIAAKSVTFSEVPVPSPLPALGAAAAFGWSRRLRRRISTSGSSLVVPAGRDS